MTGIKYSGCSASLKKVLEFPDKTHLPGKSHNELGKQAGEVIAPIKTSLLSLFFWGGSTNIYPKQANDSFVLKVDSITNQITVG